MIELDGDDLRSVPLTVHKTMLANIVGRPALGLRRNEHIEEDGPIVFHHACKLRFEDIVSTWERLAVCFRSRALRIDSPAVVFSQTVLGFLCGGTGVIHLTNTVLERFVATPRRCF